MKTRVIFASALIGAFLIGAAAQAQISVWGWWGETSAVYVPISAVNPLPVHCQ